MEAVGEFSVVITPRPGNTLTSLELTTDSILDRFKAEGPTPEELQKAKAGLELRAISALQSNLAKADILNEGSVFHDDPGEFQKDLSATRAVTAADVRRVANRYLTQGRVILSVVPRGKVDEASKPGESTLVGQNGNQNDDGASGAREGHR
jgi:zinc protease